MKAHRQPSDDTRGQLARVRLPLLFGVTTDESLIEGTTNQRDRFVFQVFRMANLLGARLLTDQFARLRGRHVAPEKSADRPQVNGHRVNLALVNGQHTMPIIGEGGEAMQVAPDFLAVGVEQVRTVFVVLDAGSGVYFGIGIASDVMAALQHADFAAKYSGRALGDGRAVKAR